MNLNLSLILYAKINSRWVIFKGKHENIKLLGKKKISENPRDLQLGEKFLDMTPQT